MDKLDLVYILGTGSKWFDNELRLSLRSAEKNLSFNKVYIIGEKPSWIKNVEHIKKRDCMSNKLQNAVEKYIVACKDERISKDFILMNDDFFTIKKVSDIPYFSRGSLNEMIKKHPTQAGYYYTALIETRKRLEKIGIKVARDFEVHAPIVFNKEKLLATIAIAGQQRNPVLLRTFYSNLNGVEEEKVLDYKVDSLLNLFLRLKTKPRFISTTDKLVFDKDFDDWLIDQFPEVSRFEKDEGIGLKRTPGASGHKSRYHARQPFIFANKQYNPGDLIEEEVGEKLEKQNNLKNIWKKD